VSELNGKVIDVQHERKEPGAKLVMWDKHTPAKQNQLFYTDPQGFIRSALNDLTFSNKTSGHDLLTEPSTNDPRGEWMFEGNKIVSRVGEAMDIKGASKHNGAEVISYPYKGAPNQHWKQEFV